MNYFQAGSLRSIAVACGLLASVIASADWPSVFQPGGDTIGRQMVTTHDGGAVMVGIRGVNHALLNVTRVAQDGTVMWQNNINSGLNMNTYRDVTVDSQNNVIVAGYAFDATLGYHWYTAKLDASAGTRLWIKRDYAIEQPYNYPNSVITDSTDNVYVAGRINRDGKTWLRLAKFAPDGTRSWELLRDGSGDPKLVLGPNDTIFMSGNMANGLDLITFKFTKWGKLIWSKQTKPAKYGQVLPLKIVVDGAGNVVVGLVAFEHGDARFALVKFDGKRGDEKWFRASNNSARSDGMNYLTGLAIGPSNSVIMSGTTFDTGPTIARFSASGEMLWNVVEPELVGWGPVGIGKDRRIYATFVQGSDAVLVVRSITGNPISRTSFTFGTFVTQVVGLGFDPTGEHVLMGGYANTTGDSNTNIFVARYLVTGGP